MRAEFVHFLTPAAIYIWRGSPGRLQQAASFTADATGRQALRHWLEQAADLPHRLILEAGHERFQSEPLPAGLSRRMRNALLARRLQRTAANATAGAWLPPARDASATLVCTGNEAALAASLQLYAETQTPVCAIHLAGLLAKPDLSLPEAALQQVAAAGGTRLLHTSNGRVQESRWLPGPAQAEALRAALRPGEQLILHGEPATLTALSANLDNTALSLRPQSGSAEERLLIRALAQRAGRVSHPNLHAGWRQRQLRRVIQCASALLCLLLLTATALDLRQAANAAQGAAALQAQIQNLNAAQASALAQPWPMPRAHWEAVLQHLPPHPASTPLHDWAALSPALTAHPALSLQRLHWQGPERQMALNFDNAPAASLASLQQALATSGCQASTPAPPAPSVSLTLRCREARS